MGKYIFKRVVNLAVLFVGITAISFAVIKLAPGSPAGIYAFNAKAKADVSKRIEKLYGLDKPLWAQYGIWFKNILRLDFGTSLTDGRKVIDKIKERVPITLGINLVVMFIIFTVSIPLGMLAGYRRGGFFDRFTTVLVFAGFAAPSFWLALLLMEYFGVKLGWFPISGLVSVDFDYFTLPQKVFDIARHLVLPVFVASFGSLAGLSRYSRSKTIETTRANYIRAALSKGLPLKIIIYRHILKGVMLPVITILGLSLPGLLGGSVIFETVFSIPGMGLLFYEAVMMRDYTLIMGLLVISAVLTLLGNLLADLLYAWADPRIRYSK